jgi:hypothetical protein
LVNAFAVNPCADPAVKVWEDIDPDVAVFESKTTGKVFGLQLAYSVVFDPGMNEVTLGVYGVPPVPAELLYQPKKV